MYNCLEIAQQKKQLIEKNRALKWIRQLCEVMLFLEKSAKKDGGSILHRDLKPSNIIIDQNDDIKLVDFGEVRALNKASETKR